MSSRVHLFLLLFCSSLAATALQRLIEEGELKDNFLKSDGSEATVEILKQTGDMRWV